MDILKTAKEIFTIEREQLAIVEKKIDKEFEKAVKLIIETKGKVVITGIGKSGIIGQKIAATLASTGTLAIFMNAAEGLHGDLGMISSDDVVIGISNSGNSDELISIIPAIKKIGAKLIAMTGNPKSNLGIHANCILNIGVEKEGCPLDLAPMSSAVATLAMGDALAAVLIKLKNFKPENFALYHPGGSLGRRLLLKVSDIMHKKEDLALLDLDTGVEEVITELSSKRLGAVCVLGDNGELEGIITEGDIRRALKNKEEFFNYKASDIMTKNPISINEDLMAIEALEIMENRENQISVLPVVRDKKELLGLLRIHDLFERIK